MSDNTKQKVKNAVIYTRVSTKEQAGYDDVKISSILMSNLPDPAKFKTTLNEALLS